MLQALYRINPNTEISMSQAPDITFRKGLIAVELKKMFPDDNTAETWFEEARWGENLKLVRYADQKARLERILIESNHYPTIATAVESTSP